MTTWHRWRWESSFSFGPWTKFHLAKDRSWTKCGRYLFLGAEPNFGTHDDNPPMEKRCKVCEQIRRKEK